MFFAVSFSIMKHFSFPSIFDYILQKVPGQKTFWMLPCSSHWCDIISSIGDLNLFLSRINQHDWLSPFDGCIAIGKSGCVRCALRAACREHYDNYKANVDHLGEESSHSYTCCWINTRITINMQQPDANALYYKYCNNSACEKPQILSQRKSTVTVLSYELSLVK